MSPPAARLPGMEGSPDGATDRMAAAPRADAATVGGTQRCGR
jgi:hypothetical protein